MALGLIERVAAVQATKAEFAGRPFEWGVVDCVAVARSHAERMGAFVPDLPDYRSANGARLALKRLGFASLWAMLEAMFERIPAAYALPGDFVLLRGVRPFDSLAIVAGAKLIGFHEDADGLVNMVPHEIRSAYRVVENV